jgi:outer membrane usher protein FimD/PapC
VFRPGRTSKSSARGSATSSVQPGPFQLTNVPIVTGAGQMQLVVRDLLGRETVISQSYCIAPVLLAPGVTDFSFEAGALRENYGTTLPSGVYSRVISLTIEY